MHMESGKPSGEDFQVESNSDDEDEKPKKDFDFVKSWLRHSKAEAYTPKDDSEDDNKTVGEELASLFETEPAGDQEEDAISVDEVEEIPPEVTEEDEFEEFPEDNPVEAVEPPAELIDNTPKPEFVEETPEPTEESAELSVEEDAHEIEESSPETAPEDITDTTVEEEAPEPEEAPVSVEEEPVATSISEASLEDGGDDGDEEEPPIGNDDASSNAGSPFAPGANSLAIPSVPIPTAETLPAKPTVNVNKGSSALPLVAALGAGYALHKAGKVGREARAQERAQSESIKNLQEAQNHRQVEFNRQLAEVRGAQELAASAAAERDKQTRVKLEQVSPKKGQEVVSPKKPEKKDTRVETPGPAKPHEQGVEKMPDIGRVSSETKTEQGVDRISKVEKLPSIGELIAEQQAASKVDQAPESMTDIPESANVTYLDPEKILETHLSDKSSELVLNQTEAAAEQNVAQEKQYELRHEVKDVASVLPGGLSATGTPTFAKDELFVKDNLAQQSPQGSYLSKDEWLKQQELQDKTSHTYKQAMWAGFWGAGIILIALAIWALSG